MDNLDMTPEMLSKAKAAASAEELISVVQGFGIELQPREAQALFAKLQARESELSDEELGGVAGGIRLWFG